MDQPAEIVDLNSIDSAAQQSIGSLVQYGALGILGLVALYAGWKFFNWTLTQLEKHRQELADMHQHHAEELKALREEHARALQAIVSQNQVVIENNTRAVVALESRVHDVSERLEEVERVIERAVPPAQWDGVERRTNGG